MNALQTPLVPRGTRKRVAGVLRWVAGLLREETPIAVSTAGMAARSSTPPATPVEDPEREPAPAPVTEPLPVPAPDPVTEPPPVVPGDDEDERIRNDVVAAMHTIFDPEIPVDIYELGLIYAVDVRPDRTVNIRMTLTSPNCPAAQSLPAEVEVKATAVEGVDRADVEVVFEPAWTPDLMSDEAKLELNIG